MQLLQHNLMQARMSPSLTADQHFLQQQQVFLEQNLLNQHQILEQTNQGQIIEQQAQNLLDQTSSQTQFQPHLLNQQLGMATEISNQNQALQQHIIQQQQNIIVQQAAAIQQKQYEEQIAAQENIVPQTNLVTGQTLDPSLQNLQNILAQIIHRPETIQSRKESESETQQQQQQAYQQENLDLQQEQQNQAQEMQNVQNLVANQLQQASQNFQQQQYIQPNILNAVDATILMQQQQVAQAQQQMAQAQQQLNMQKQMLAHQQLALQQQLMMQQPLQMAGQTLSPQHIRNFQQHQYLAQQELQLQTQQNLIDQQNLALLAQKQQLMGQQQQKVEEMLRAHRPMYQRQGSEQSQISSADVHDQQVLDYQQKPPLHPQMSMDQAQFLRQNQMQKVEEYHQMQQMQGQSLPHTMVGLNVNLLQQSDRQISSHEGTPVQNYAANPLQLYQQAQSQPMQHIVQNIQSSVTPMNQGQSMPQEIQQVPQTQPVQTAPQTIQSVPQPVQSAPPIQSVPQPVQSAPQPVQSVPQPVQTVPQPIPQAVQTSQPVQSQPVQTAPIPQSMPSIPQTLPSIPTTEIPQQLNIPAEHMENGFNNNGQKEQFLTPLTEFPSGATHVEAIRPPDLSSVDEKQSEQQEGESRLVSI